MLYYTVVLASTIYGGRIQGFLAMLYSVMAGTLFFTSDWQAVPFRYALFIFDSSVLIFLCSALTDAKRRAEEALKSEQIAHNNRRQTDLQFRRIFESQMIGLMFTHSNGTIVQCNDYVLRLLGYTREDFENNKFNWRTLTPPEFRERSEQALHEMLATDTVKPFEKEYLCKDGSRATVLIGASRVEADLWVTFVMDIGESKKAQQALARSRTQLESHVEERTRSLHETTLRLEQSQKFLDSVIENIPNMVFVKDAAELRFVRFNKAGEHLLGVSSSDLIGKNDFDFFPSEQAQFFQDKDRSVLESGSELDIPEEPLSTKQGLRYLHTRKIPILDTDGKPIYLLGISEDITERKEAETQHLRLIKEQAARGEAEKTAQQLRFLSDASASLNESLDLKSMLDGFAKTVITHMADWCEIILIDEAELKVQEVFIAHRDPAKVELANRFRTVHSVNWNQSGGTGLVLRTGKPLLYPRIDSKVLEDNLEQAEHREMILSLGIRSAVVVPLQSYGRVIGVLSISSAESGRVYNEIDLAVLMDLAKRASFAIENSRLFSKAQEASQAKSSFLANMSHELRTPLGAMLGFAELLTDDPLPPEQRSYLDTLLRNGQQLLRIVDEILDLSKVESDRIHIERVEFNLHELINEVIALMRLQAQHKSLILNIDSLSEIPEYITSDPTRLRQILINVIGNAIKFTLTGNVDVHIEVHPRAAHPSHPILEVSVRDTGIGIARNQRDKLFKPFVQGDSSMTRRFGGTGLGLFLARRMARLLGGDVVLGASEIEHGSQFIVTLEIETLTQIRPATSDAKVIPLAQEVKGDGHEVLIVDDAPDNRMLMQLYVNRMGFHTDTAATGREAVEKALLHEYRVILMDVQMPEMDGFEAVHELRSHDYRGPIVALTAHTMKGDRERCLKGGFDDYLGKPIDREMLKKSLERFVPQLH